MHKISIILPVYNVENYLNRCLTSLQPYVDAGHEMIIVSDGSTDGSPLIVDAFCATNPQVILVKQTHKGPSAARNKGLEYATNDYIWFVDSDDYVSDITEQLESLLHAEPDILAFGRMEEYGSWNMKAPQNIEDAQYATGTEYLKASINNGTFRTHVWDKIFKRSVICDNELRFVEGMLYEDMYFMVLAAVHSQKVVTTRLFPYHYIHYNVGSITKTVRMKDLDVLEFIQIMDDYFEANPTPDFNNHSLEYHKLIFTWVSSCLMNKYSWKVLYDKDAKYIFSQTVAHPLFMRSVEYCSKHNVGLRQKVFARLLLSFPALYKIILATALKVQYIKNRIQSGI